MSPFSRTSIRHLKHFLLVYVLGIAFFTFFRLLLVATNTAAVSNITTNKTGLLLQAFFMGWRFDTVISCYLLVLPAVLLGVGVLLSILTKGFLKGIYIFTGIVFAFAFLICATDIPFFNYFFSRLNDTVFNWAGNTGFGIKMVIQEPKFLIYFFVFIATVICYLWLLRKIYRSHLQILKLPRIPVTLKQRLAIVPFTLLIWALIFLGIRGRTNQKSPIHPGIAFFSNNAFINQLGLNPVFTLLRSTLDSQNPVNQSFHKMEDAEALQTMAKLLHADDSLKAISPIARYQNSEAAMQGRNLVLVMMEGMSAAKMQRFGHSENLTPFLDSLAGKCWSFDHIYSAGLHTYNGVYSTLFAHPAILKHHTMNAVNTPQMAGFATILGNHNYQSIFFTTHDEAFDNMGGFLSANDFEQIIGQKDYPAEEVKSTLGVPDEFMFRFCIPKLNALAGNKRPFFAAFMTASDHDPIVIPENTGFKRQHKEDKQAVVSYADWSLQRFMSYAAKQDWYANTVFVFVADHGALVGENAYDLRLNYNHIPFLIYAPGATESKSFPQLGLQTDVFPTVTSLLIPRFINNTFGIDLRTESRPFAVFSADDKLACMSDSLLYIWRMQSHPGLYHYRDNNTENLLQRYPQMADSMQHIAFSWLQTSEWMRKHNKTSIPKLK